MKNLLVCLCAIAGLLFGALAVSQDESPGRTLLSPDRTPLPEQSATADVVNATPEGTLELQGGSAAAGIGFVWGSGKLDYQGAKHAFGIHGISVVSVGGSRIHATGVVIHLDKLENFPGSYSELNVGATVGSGESAIYLKNEHGVVIKLVSRTTGLRFNLAAGGVNVRLKK